MLAKGKTIAAVAEALGVSSKPISDVKHKRLAYAA